MFCPHTIVMHTRNIVVTRHDGADYHGPVPWPIRLNLLRYQITLFPGPGRWTFNKDGWLARELSNLTWWLWRRRAFDRRQARRQH